MFLRNFFLLFLILPHLGFWFWPSKKNTSPVNAHWVEVLNQEALQAYPFLAQESHEGNHLLSPVQNARKRGWNHEEFVFKKSDFTPEEEIKALNVLKTSLLQNQKHGMKIEFQEILLGHKDFSFKRKFKAVPEKYKIEFRKIDFKKMAHVKKVEKEFWKKTHQTLAVDISLPDPKSEVLPISGFYLKGLWRDGFDATKTQPESFETGQGPRQVLMMVKQGYHGYLNEEAFEAVDLRYGDGKFSLLVFLPKAGRSLEDFYSQLSMENWKTWQTSFHESEGEVFLPRFRIRDFSALLVVASIEVEEAGGEDKFQYDMSEVLGTVERFQFKANRPFFFAVTDNETDLIVLLGQVNHPQS